LTPGVGVDVERKDLSRFSVDIAAGRANVDVAHHAALFIFGDEQGEARSKRTLERLSPHLGTLLDRQSVQVRIGHEATAISTLPRSNVEGPEVRRILQPRRADLDHVALTS
jgi:hypothetical protein